MLQQDEPEDFVIATGSAVLGARVHRSGRPRKLGIELRFEGDGVDEIGIVDSVDRRPTPRPSRRAT